MASGQMLGTVGLHAGSEFSHADKLGEIDASLVDASAGDSDEVYINGVQQPAQRGTPWSIGTGPHVEPGENIYVSLTPITSDTIDSDDTLAVVHLQVARYNRQGKFLGTKLFSRVAQRNTNTDTGGLSDDPAVNADQQHPIYAFGPAPAGEFWTLFGRAELNIRDDTA